MGPFSSSVPFSSTSTCVFKFSFAINKIPLLCLSTQTTKMRFKTYIQTAPRNRIDNPSFFFLGN
uniref:Uncharacterized protein n=1 Tax=Rhizophora mucronata TaxID=61149 RepID=A0A2P2LIB9_RHIMU